MLPPRYEENAPPENAPPRYEQDDPPPEYTEDSRASALDSERSRAVGNSSGGAADIDRELETLYDTALAFLYPSQRTRAFRSQRCPVRNTPVDLERGTPIGFERGTSRLERGASRGNQELPERPKKKKSGKWWGRGVCLLIAAIVAPIVACKVLEVGVFSPTFGDWEYTGVRPGTSLAAFSQSYDWVRNPRYGVVYQMATGQVRTSIHYATEIKWKIVNMSVPAIDGTPLATTIKTNASTSSESLSSWKPISLTLFYIAQNGTLQELTMSEVDGMSRTPGSLGKAVFNASTDPISPLALRFPGDTDVTTNICGTDFHSKWLMYRPQGETYVQELLWDKITDEWHPGARFYGLDPYSDFVTTFDQEFPPYYLPYQEGSFTKRLIGVGTDGRVKTWKCLDCCGKSTDKWMEQTDATSLPFSTFLPPNITMANWSEEFILIHRADPDADNGIYTLNFLYLDDFSSAELIKKKKILSGSSLAAPSNDRVVSAVFYQVRSDYRIRTNLGLSTSEADSEYVPVRPLDW